MSAAFPLLAPEAGRMTAAPGLPPEPDWLDAMRRGAWERWTALGMPSPRQEAWRYTTLEPLALFKMQPAPRPSLEGARGPLPAELAGRTSSPHRLVFLNGHFVAPWSSTRDLPNGVAVETLTRLVACDPERLRPLVTGLAAAADQSFTTLNTALFADGVAIFADDNARVDEPIELLFVTQGGEAPVTTCPRVLVSADAESRLTVVERHIAKTPAVGFADAVTEVFVRPGAEVRHVRHIHGPAATCHIGQTYVSVARGASYRSHLTAFGARLVRDELHVRLDGPGATCDATGLALARQDERVDAQTMIDHATPQAASRQLYKGIYGDRAAGIFNGKIIVRPGAQKTDARQTNRNLLLSEAAVAYTRPQLEIYADDVKCAHGATVGQLDDEAVFYLRSRGLDLAQARAVLTQAFANEVLATIDHAELRRFETQAVAAWLDGTAGGRS